MDVTKNSSSAFIFFILVILGRYLGTNIDCDTRKILNNNIFARQILLFLFILLALTARTNNIISVTNHILLTLQVWFMALLFTKLDVYSMIGILLLFSLTKLIEGIKIDDNKDDNKKENNKMFKLTSEKRDKLINMIYILTYMLLFIGFSIGYIRKEKGDNFSHIKYIFGGYGCHNSS